MWNIEQLEILGLDFEPIHNAFTYTFPPPAYARKYGKVSTSAALSINTNWLDLSLYIHIPFCRINCNFCSLHRQTVKNDELIISYLEALYKEIRAYKPCFEKVPVKAIYIGGGTASILSKKQMNQLLDEITENFSLAEYVEVCVECAPDIRRTASDWEHFFTSLVSRSSLPVNRISFGIQSFDEVILRAMGRQGGMKSIFQLLNAVNDTVFNYNVDFIIGYPASQGSQLSPSDHTNNIVSSITKLLKDGYRIPSISLYQLWDVQTIPIMQSHFVKNPHKNDLLISKWELQQSLFELGYKPGIVSSLVRETSFKHLWTHHKYSGTYSWLSYRKR